MQLYNYLRTMIHIYKTLAINEQKLKKKLKIIKITFLMNSTAAKLDQCRGNQNTPQKIKP